MLLDPAFCIAMVVFFFVGLVVDTSTFYSWPSFLDGGERIYVYLFICIKNYG